MKRQRSRGRGSSGGGGGGGGKPGHNVNRAFDSNGPDGVKIRGAAQHVFEKYQQLARDAASGGDRVLAETTCSTPSTISGCCARCSRTGR